MDKLLEFISKAKYPTVFLGLGAVFALVAAAKSLKLFGIDIVLASEIARATLGLLALALLGLGVFLVFREGRGAPAAAPAKYDVFIAAPMAGTDSDAEYQAMRRLCLEVLAALRAHCGVTSYYFVGEKLETKAQFESFNVAAELDFDAIAVSRRFVLIYPKKLVSSVLAEAGYALARRIPSLYLVRRAEDLPYLLRSVADLPDDRFAASHVRVYDTDAALLQQIKNDGPNLFGPPKAPPSG